MLQCQCSQCKMLSRSIKDHLQAIIEIHCGECKFKGNLHPCTQSKERQHTTNCTLFQNPFCGNLQLSSVATHFVHKFEVSSTVTELKDGYPTYVHMHVLPPD